MGYPVEDVPQEVKDMAVALKDMCTASLDMGWTMDDIAELAMALGDEE